ncbi:MAG: hypothetical protein E7Z72_00640 [Methanocorpusculum parvum]|nr:hypothetical protein [Methanocorpusculum parvum]
MKTDTTNTITGDDRLVAMLERSMKDMTETAAKAMMKFAGEIMGRSVDLAPIVTGELRSRSFIEGPLINASGTGYIAVIGYEKHGVSSGGKNPNAKGNFYAVPVHERLDVRHPKGQAKFLEQPYKAASGEYLEYIANAVKEELNDRH